MTGHRSYQEMVDALRAEMSPERRAHFDGYQEGFKNAYDIWEWELNTSTIRSFLRLRRQIRRRLKDIQR